MLQRVLTCAVRVLKSRSVAVFGQDKTRASPSASRGERKHDPAAVYGNRFFQCSSLNVGTVVCENELEKVGGGEDGKGSF